MKFWSFFPSQFAELGGTLCWLWFYSWRFLYWFQIFKCGHELKQAILEQCCLSSYLILFHAAWNLQQGGPMMPLTGLQFALSRFGNGTGTRWKAPSLNASVTCDPFLHLSIYETGDMSLNVFTKPAFFVKHINLFFSFAVLSSWRQSLNLCSC